MSENIPNHIFQRIADYKSQVAGKYRSLSPQDISSAIFSGKTILSPKIDGETWLLYSRNGKAWLLSPSGKVITGIPATDEAAEMLGNRELLAAGELYAVGNSGRPRLHDLQSALGCPIPIIKAGHNFPCRV
jgi:ATP-dependent DNA ligase